MSEETPSVDDIDRARDALNSMIPNWGDEWRGLPHDAALSIIDAALDELAVIRQWQTEARVVMKATLLSVDRPSMDGDYRWCGMCGEIGDTFAQIVHDPDCQWHRIRTVLAGFIARHTTQGGQSNGQ